MGKTVKFARRAWLHVLVTVSWCAVFNLTAAYAAPQRPTLERVPFERVAGELTVDQRVFTQRHDLLQSIEQTRVYLKSEEGRGKLAGFDANGIDANLVEESLARFAFLLSNSSSYGELVQRIRDSFDLYRSVGSDGRGSVRFTGYFRPIYEASPERAGAFKYPLFRRPDDFASWPEPHPTRVELEGYDGLGGAGTRLAGLELAYVRTRFEAFMIHVQGSAILDFPDGRRQAIGFAGATSYPFRGIPADYLRSRKVAWNKLSQFFAVNPGELDRLLSANNRFIFFAEQVGGAPVGSLGLPVVEERSIAIDQLHLPPGAVSIIRTALPHRDGKGNLRLVPSSRFVLNLDSGSAIRGPGRVDVFMGTGEEARQRANYVHGDGELYYLFVKRRRDVTVQARARVDDSARASLRRPDGASAVVPAKAGTRRGADR